MPRPTIDVNGAEYREVLRKRDMYRRYGVNYKDVMWMEHMLGQLEKKLPDGDYSDKDRADFLKVKDIYARIFVKAGTGNGETAENHTTTHYVWRTAGDDKVRSEHAVNDGKVFAWDEPPSTGNPGEAFGCRCWAEPYKEDILQERCSQTVSIYSNVSTYVWMIKTLGIIILTEMDVVLSSRI